MSTIDHSGIIWSSVWQQQSWRITALPRHQFRTTYVRHSQGGTHLDTQTHADASSAWRHLIERWLIDTEIIYNAAETRFRADILGYAHGRPGFRPGSPALRTRAERSRNDLFAMARSCGRDWLRLRAQIGAVADAAALPAWLVNALDDLAGPSADDVPPIEHWLRAT